MTDQPVWTEADSRDFLDLADIAVPSRREQMDVLISLIPARPEEEFNAVEIGCGAGLLSAQVLERFGGCRLLALDGSDLMRETARERLSVFGDRATVRDFDLLSFAWLEELPSGLRFAVSSLVLHHADGPGKRKIFRRIANKLEPGGVLLIADIVEPASELVRLSFATLYDQIAKRQSLESTGSLDAFMTLEREGWNAYASAQPEPGELPSPLFGQLKWLEEAGFSSVDCFWMRAGHAIYGGYR